MTTITDAPDAGAGACTCLPGGAETMTTNTTNTAGPEYVSGAGLRALLRRLHAAGDRAWADDPVAAELMRFCAEKYGALARKHSLDPWEAASAAFDVMRTRSAREAHDPWGVVTHAVRITCIAEERAQGLLCSTHQARRPHISAFHDAERISDRETPLWEYHPAFQVTDPGPADDDPDDRTPRPAGKSATTAVQEAIELVTRLGWEPGTARAAVEHICGALAKAGARHTAFENLRRDQYARALLDVPGRSWIALLKALLGDPHPALAATPAGRGVLLRLLLDESVPMLLSDDDLVLTLWQAAPGRGRK